MTFSDLKKLLPDLQSKKFFGLNDNQLLAFVRIYSSIYNMIVANGVDAEYGRREIYQERLHSLCDIFIRRVYNRETLWEKSKLLYAAFWILYNVDLTVNREREEECLKLNQQVVDAFFEKVQRKKDVDFMETFWVMRMMFIQLYGYVDEGGEQPRTLTFIRHRLAEWQKELDEKKDCWVEEVSVKEALLRMMLFAMNSIMLLDFTYRERITKTFAYYLKRVPKDDLQLRLWAFDIMLLREPSTHENIEMLNDFSSQSFSPKQDEDLIFQALQIQHLCSRVL